MFCDATALHAMCVVCEEDHNGASFNIVSPTLCKDIEYDDMQNEDFFGMVCIFDFKKYCKDFHRQ